ncbi:MAG: multiple sugar transport system ATP-binding protein, partial [Pseudonocardiales bacterium]|nr:multiple sugar transport system ATP-binding protein [Pseudonocardiales bacterium]
MAEVVYDSASRIYTPGAKPAVNKLSLDIEDGEFVVFVGPSGCGKSTALRMLAGLEEIDDGAIRIGGKNMVG